MNKMMDFISEDKDPDGNDGVLDNNSLTKITTTPLNCYMTRNNPPHYARAKQSPFVEAKSETASSFFRILPPLKPREISPRYHKSLKSKLG